MTNYDALHNKVTKDMKPMSAKSPYKPHIAAQVEEEPEGLRRLLFQLDTMFSEEIIEDAQFVLGDFFHDHMHKTVTVQYKTWLWGQHLDTKVVHLPLNWFEHLRATILPEFILDRWPIKTQKIEVDIKAIYPQLRKKLELTDEAHVVHGEVVYGREDEEDNHN